MKASRAEEWKVNTTKEPNPREVKVSSAGRKGGTYASTFSTFYCMEQNRRTETTPKFTRSVQETFKI